MKSVPFFRYSFALLLLSILPPALAVAADKLKDEDCLACHGERSLAAESNGKSVSLFVDAAKMKQSIHGQTMSCVGCHTDVKSLGHETAPKKIGCAGCHAQESRQYLKSYHAQRAKNGLPAASCQDCHGDVHQVVPVADASSPVSHAKAAEACGRCHAQDALMRSNGLSAQAYFAYQLSAHGRALAAGDQKSATCTDCHEAHDIRPASDSASTVTKVRLAATCGKCHGQEAQEFNASAHGAGLMKGASLSPSCTGCHGVHAIASKNDADSPTSARNLSREVCARCHDGQQLSEEYGVPGNRVSSYLNSYHGMASIGGSREAANCSSCHGVHKILPSSDAQSTIAAANLKATCGKCHEGASAKFVSAKVHLDPALGAPAHDLGGWINLIVRWIYIVLIVVVIGGMFAHNLILWLSKARRRRAGQNPFMTRMTVQQRWQHLTLLTSFIVLVITGFALKFPETWLGHLLVGYADGERVRSLLHRVAGCVLIAAGFYHVVYVAAMREGRRLLRDMWPVKKDLIDFLAAMRYYLGLGGERPRFGRFSYGEKAEYWALVWGAAIMAITGVMMWANVATGNLLARWWVTVATTIHFYEAIMATLAIFVWHFYMVFLDPDTYPMNWAWFDGKMPVEQYRHEHELDVEALAEAEGLEDKGETHPE